ncbi:hypothetical protein AgCh_012974 [Apium graveolens]
MVVENAPSCANQSSHTIRLEGSTPEGELSKFTPIQLEVPITGTNSLKTLAEIALTTEAGSTISNDPFDWDNVMIDLLRCYPKPDRLKLVEALRGTPIIEELEIHKGHYSSECRNQPAREPTNKDQPIWNPAVKVPAIGFTCFKYGKPGHMARDCKTPALVSNALRIMGSTPTVNETPRARVFDMSVKDAIQDTDVVAGTLNVNSLCAKVLVDSGATRSFVSQDFVSKLNCPVECLNEIMTVELANRERVTVNQVCGNCEVEISGSKFCVDLIPFKLGEFDVILGMDWLSKHDAQIDCRNKKVMVKTPDEMIITFKGEKQVKKFLTMIQAKKLLRQGCNHFIAYVIDRSQEPAKFEDIPVVNEFPDVFPDELPGLPPDREIEFAIDLALGTEPVSKAPYRMAPVEMKELAKQL